MYIQLNFHLSLVMEQERECQATAATNPDVGGNAQSRDCKGCGNNVGAANRPGNNTDVTNPKGNVAAQGNAQRRGSGNKLVWLILLETMLVRLIQGVMLLLGVTIIIKLDAMLNAEVVESIKGGINIAISISTD
ncbi:uncharacterized protein LOC110410632 isoform X2 [Herrania umbratica]|uniref:Uncharacterized protein LOC110410632 isoform X2 n=1 Tax=Herrania umbratica TaxID=108875 RepID=A0A6J0ZNK6_9ROSI|nr:uncharacterized protein LOC110410632 isoform X2 [Herrania umbratica]